MARLLRDPLKQKPSKAEAAGTVSEKARRLGTLNIQDTAAFLGLHKYTVKEYVDKGLIQTISIGSRRYVDEPELARVKKLLEEHGSLAKAYKEHTEHQRLDAMRRTIFGN